MGQSTQSLPARPQGNSPDPTLKEDDGGRAANRPESGVSGRLWDAHVVFVRITRSCQGQPVPLSCLSSLQMFIFPCPSSGLALNFLRLSFNPTREAAAIYSGKALVNCLFFSETRICIPAATAFFSSGRLRKYQAGLRRFILGVK